MSIIFFDLKVFTATNLADDLFHNLTHCSGNTRNNFKPRPSTGNLSNFIQNIGYYKRFDYSSFLDSAVLFRETEDDVNKVFIVFLVEWSCRYISNISKSICLLSLSLFIKNRESNFIVLLYSQLSYTQVLA